MARVGVQEAEKIIREKLASYEEAMPSPHPLS